MIRATPMTRRQALAGAAAFSIVPRYVLGGPGHVPPSQKLNLAAVGIGGAGSSHLANIGDENVVALCDVDRRRLDRYDPDSPAPAVPGDRFNAYVPRERLKGAKLYTDFRKMLETQKNIDAVMIATPDHWHAVITMAALRMGKHVYCQKPLTHSVYEARMIAKAAKEAKVATQMGNQAQADGDARLIAEFIWSGAIGTVREVHAGSSRFPAISPRGVPRPSDKPPQPPALDWDLWLGPARRRPYHSCYHPFKWRGWWDFGTGCLGDIGCHQFSSTFKALRLGHPTSVEACSSNQQCPPEIADETAPLSSIVRWEFPAAEKRAAVRLTWWDGGMKPPRPAELEPGRSFAEGDWLMIVGDEGTILDHRLIPEAKARKIGRPPRLLPRSPGHYVEWFHACKGGPPAGANFIDHAAHLAEVVLLGNIAIRTPQKLLWDGDNLRFTNSAVANKLVNPPYRTGWRL